LDDVKQILSNYNNNLLNQKYEGTSAEVINQYIQSLQQPEVFDIEVELESISHGRYFQPKITNNQIKINTKI